MSKTIKNVFLFIHYVHKQKDRYATFLSLRMVQKRSAAIFLFLSPTEERTETELIFFFFIFVYEWERKCPCVARDAVAWTSHAQGVLKFFLN